MKYSIDLRGGVLPGRGDASSQTCQRIGRAFPSAVSIPLPARITASRTEIVALCGQ
jgi:hypothetical protein